MSNFCRDCFQCFCCIHCPNPNKPHLSYAKQPADSNWSLDYPQYAFGMHVVWQNIFITRGFLDQKVRIQINPIKCCLRLLGEFRFAAASARPCHMVGAYSKQGAKTKNADVQWSLHIHHVEPLEGKEYEDLSKRAQDDATSCLHDQRGHSAETQGDGSGWANKLVEFGKFSTLVLGPCVRHSGCHDYITLFSYLSLP